MNTTATNYYQKWIDPLPDRNDRILKRDLSVLKSLDPKNTRVHLIGICGKGTATLAGLLIDKGFIMSGSDDTFYPPMSTVVESLGIQIFKSYTAENINGADVIIVGNVCPPNNIEVVAAKEKNILQISMSEALEYFFLQDKKPIVVTGTHGKTTLTGMISWILENAGLDPMFFIGGVVRGHHTSHRFSNGPFCVLEGDEYDTAYFDKGPKFLHYKPWCGIITSCEYDHVTMYPSFDEYKKAFEFFIAEIEPNGFLVIHEKPYALLKDHMSFSGTCIVYGSSDESQYRIIKSDYTEQTSTAHIAFGTHTDSFTIPHPGFYNLENALAAYIVATKCCQIPGDIAANHLATFPGMERRQQTLFKNDDYLFIDDFAHHPTAVQVTLEGLRSQFPHRRIVCLFEPRSNSSRKKIFEEPYSKSFGSADVVCICAPALRWNDNPDDFVDINHIVALLNDSGKLAYGMNAVSDVLETLQKIMQPGDVIVTMSNASFDNIQEKILEILNSKK